MRAATLTLVLALMTAACDEAPLAPSQQPFPLAAGAYLLSINGLGGPCVSSGGVSSSAQIPIQLAADGEAWALSVPGESLSGRLTSDGLPLSGTVQGSADAGAVIFQTSEDGTGGLTLSGGARDGDKFEGMVTSGQPYFRGTGATSGGFATCLTTGFELRAAS
jgi:hypothetical protein